MYRIVSFIVITFLILGFFVYSVEGEEKNTVSISVFIKNIDPLRAVATVDLQISIVDTSETPTKNASVAIYDVEHAVVPCPISGATNRYGKVLPSFTCEIKSL